MSEFEVGDKIKVVTGETETVYKTYQKLQKDIYE